MAPEALSGSGSMEISALPPDSQAAPTEAFNLIHREFRKGLVPRAGKADRSCRKTETENPGPESL